MNDVNTALSSLQHWAVRAHRDGWIPDAVLDKVSAHKPHDPSALFADGAASPLVLAFFGGTGVGKSSLLNRLAGSPIAKSSAVRPTSREVTLYLHEDVALADLPAGIPVELTTVKRHQHPEHRDSLWIDTPDIDSVITTHRDQVLAWLPYIDLLVYVVSPERYRDDAGWDMLQANRHRHDWAFVMNHWDRGDPAQRDDFVQLLTNGGIESPHVFCTDCRDGGAADDDFEALTAYVASQSDALALAEARRRSERNERAAQDALRDTCLQALGSDADWAALGADLSATAKPFATQCLSDAIAPREQTLRGLFPDDPPPFWRQVLGAQDRAEVSAGTVALWSERSQERLRGRLDELMIRAAERGMPVAPLRRALQPVAEDAEVDVNGQATQALAQALDQPGVALQRAALRVTDTMSKL
ncbi:MAG: GTPase [Pseudomonadota bacterium]